MGPVRGLGDKTQEALAAWVRQSEKGMSMSMYMSQSKSKAMN